MTRVNFVRRPDQVAPVSRLNNSLNDHRIGNLSETGNVSAVNVVDEATFLWHVRTVTDYIHTILCQVLGVLAIDLVLSRRWERIVCLVIPERIVIHLGINGSVNSGFVLVGVLFHSATTDVLQFHDKFQLLAINTRFVIDLAVGVGQSHRLAAEVKDLLDCVLQHVPGMG